MIRTVSSQRLMRGHCMIGTEKRGGSSSPPVRFNRKQLHPSEEGKSYSARQLDMGKAQLYNTEWHIFAQSARRKTDDYEIRKEIIEVYLLMLRLESEPWLFDQE